MPVSRLYPITLFFLIWACIYPSSVDAQTPFFSAQANRSTVGVGEQFQVTYTLNGSGRNFSGPNFNDFLVLSGPNQSSSIQFINGNMSQSISLTYILQAKSEGNFKIGPASIEAEGKRIASNVINMTVVKGNPSAQNQGRGQGQGNQSEDNGGLSSKNIFIRANLNKTSVYKGEAVVVSFKLYTNVNIVNYTVSKMPAFNGCWNQEIELPQQLELTNENVDGVNYRVGELKKVVLFPQQDGTLSIDPMELECIARVQTKSGRRGMDPFGMFGNDPFFNDPFFGFGGVRDVKFAFKSNPVKITVRPLPAGAPADFNGSVGRMNFEASIDKKETKANEPVTLKLRISGSGNIKLAEAPELEFPQDFESYDPKISDNLKSGNSGVNGTKTFEYLLIPRAEGSYTLDPIKFTYFDLDKGKYITQSAGPFQVKVNRGSGQLAGSAVSISKSEVQVLGKDIRYIKVHEPEFGLGSGSFYGSIAYYSLFSLPVLLFGGLLAYRKNREKLLSNSQLLRSRNATSVAQKRLQAAQKLLQTNDHSSVYEEISKALWGYVSDKLTIPISELSKDSISSQLSTRGVESGTIHEYLTVLQNCEYARYGGSALAGSATEVYNQAHQLIIRLEGELKA